MIDVFDRLDIRAATIDELLSSEFEPMPGQKDDAELAGRRLGMWCRSAASGDWGLFLKRLHRDGLSLELVLPRLGTVRSSPNRPVPQWLVDARWIDAAVRKTPAQSSLNELSLEAALPFEDLFLALAEEAKALRNQRLSSTALARIGPKADDNLTRLLLRDISTLCSRALFERFSIFRGDGTKAPEPNRSAPRDRSDVGYHRFLEEMRVRGWSAVFAEKPVLLRLISTLTRQWIDVTGEFLVRLDLDVGPAREQLLAKHDVSLVVQIKAELSDRHNLGRSVYIVHFADGTAIVYKPRDLRVDTRWSDLVAWLNKRAPPFDLRVPRVLACDGYGWAEFIEYDQCEDRGGVEMFFNRAGSWLALFHIFAGADMHEENMIAAGPYPVPIDLEMILQAQGSGSDVGVGAMRSMGIAMRTLAESVLATGLLPTLVRDPEAKVRRRGGLNDRGVQRQQIGWFGINTDEMRHLGRQTVVSEAQNMPMLLNERISLGEFGPALISGFNAYADFLSHQRQSILREGVLSAFAGLPIRRVLRPTRVYFMLLSRLRDHRYMTDGAEWSTHLDFVARFSDWDQPMEPLWPLCAAERSAMCELNIPAFRGPSDEDTLADHNGVAAKTGEQSGLSRAMNRISGFGNEEVAWQKDVVRLSILTVTKSHNKNSTSEKSGTGAPIDRTTTPIEPFARANRIAENISQWAIRDGESAAWLGLVSFGDSDASQLAALGFDLYNGSTGIALFLSAHAHITDCPESRSLALSALAPLRHVLHTSGANRFTRAIGIGGASGLGSIVYALSVASRLLNDEDLLADAKFAATLFTADVIASDRDLDVIDGAAGGILGLLRLFRDSRAQIALDRAVRCGEHLLKVTPQGNFVFGLSRIVAGRPLTGFSHGAAGFAYALSSLAAATGRDDFSSAAKNCLDYERSLYSAERHNWPQFVSSDNGSEVLWPCQWCHGAAGIGLARLGMNRTTTLDTYKVDIEAAIVRVQESSPSDSDTLCCGNLGNIEFLIEAGDAFNSQYLRDQAAQKIEAVCAAADLAQGFKLGTGGGRYNLGFFRGLAGVGYTLLRQTDSRRLPNVLIWE